MKAAVYTFAALGIIFVLAWRLGKFLHNADQTPKPDSWECTNCGFTASKPLGVCPLCKQ